MSHRACLQKALTKIPRNSHSWKREQCEGRDLLSHKGLKWPRAFLMASGMDSPLTGSMNFKFDPQLGASCCLSQLSQCRLILKIWFSLITDHLQINYTLICWVPQVSHFPCHWLRKLVQELWGVKRRKGKLQGKTERESQRHRNDTAFGVLVQGSAPSAKFFRLENKPWSCISKWMTN